MSAPKKLAPFLRVVGGTEVSAAVVPSRRPSQRGSNRRVQAKDESDPIFFEIARHRAAVASYNYAIENEEYSYGLREDMLLMARIVVLTEPTTRRGLIALAKYLEQQFDMEADCAGCMSMDDLIGGKPWPQVALKTLRQALSHMAPELDK